MTAGERAIAVPSPCNKVCILDPATQTCIGCFRTMDEIARWSGMDDVEKAGIVAALADRRKRSATPGAGEPGPR